jgi:hypothetical protein
VGWGAGGLQTGSGKTYTMEGTDSDRGINPRTLARLFEQVCVSAHAGAGCAVEGGLSFCLSSLLLSSDKHTPARAVACAVACACVRATCVRDVDTPYALPLSRGHTIYSLTRGHTICSLPLTWTHHICSLSHTWTHHILSLSHVDTPYALTLTWTHHILSHTWTHHMLSLFLTWTHHMLFLSRGHTVCSSRGGGGGGRGYACRRFDCVRVRAVACACVRPGR